MVKDKGDVSEPEESDYMTWESDDSPISTLEEWEEESTENSGRGRHSAVLMVLLILLFSAAVVAGLLATGTIKLGQSEAAATPEAPKCPPEVLDFPEDIAGFQLNVLNGTERLGIAGRTATTLEEMGFSIGEVDNFSLQDSKRVVAAVVAGVPGRANALATQGALPGTDYFEDGRTDNSVTLILGDKFEASNINAELKREPGKLSCPRFEGPEATDPATLNQ